jgi:hypothetical protein
MDTVLLPKFDTYTSKPFGVMTAVSGVDPTLIDWLTEYVAANAGESPDTRASSATIHSITGTRIFIESSQVRLSLKRTVAVQMAVSPVALNSSRFANG